MKRLLILLTVTVLLSCTRSKVKETNRHSDYHYTTIDQSKVDCTEHVYIPIYSNIYYVDAHHTFSLAATLSIRNT